MAGGAFDGRAGAMLRHKPACGLVGPCRRCLPRKIPNKINILCAALADRARSSGVLPGPVADLLALPAVMPQCTSGWRRSHSESARSRGISGRTNSSKLRQRWTKRPSIGCLACHLLAVTAVRGCAGRFCPGHSGRGSTIGIRFLRSASSRRGSDSKHALPIATERESKSAENVAGWIR